MDCHSSKPEPVFLLADSKKLYYSTSIEGVSPDNAGFIDEFLKLGFEDLEFKLSQEQEAEFRVRFDFKVRETSDSLVPPESEIKLFYGTCRISVTRPERTVFEVEIKSSVNSSKDPKEVSKLIINTLMQRAYYRVTKALDKELSGGLE
ncbi:MAG: hypothetical protein ACYS8W_03985 [Planctomycetota bacterium]|jgi:hypothetical protein